jgi:AcrR family transcriptional regulator
MKASRSSRSRRASRQTVSRDDVVHAAFEILDEQGLDALTMANVAERVGFTTMAVYRHVNGREDLIDAAVGKALAPLTHQPTGEAEWLDGVVGWMNALRSCLRAHPWAITLLGSRKGAGPALQQANEILCGYLQRSPLSRRDRGRAVAWTGRVTIGILIEELAIPVGDSLPAGLQLDVGSDPDQPLIIDDDVLFADAIEQTRRFLSRLAAGDDRE